MLETKEVSTESFIPFIKESSINGQENSKKDRELYSAKKKFFRHHIGKCSKGSRK